MKPFVQLLLIVSCMAAGNGWAWSNHSLLSYRALENMPEVAGAAPVAVEPLEAFLKAEEKGVESLLAGQESWARANVDAYAPRPDILAFKADPARSDAARRLAFLTALRVSPNSKFALFLQPDARGPSGATSALPYSAVSLLPEPADSTYRFVGLKPGQLVPALAVVASASDEPDYGLDINLWEDSPSEWGKAYGFGKLPFGNPALNFSTQAPFHMGFFHQDWLILKAAPFIRRTLPTMRVNQYSGLAALAFRSGHAYWGWRFTGLALHHVQDLSQPYHANLAPGNSSVRLISANVLAMAGFPRQRDDIVVLLSNRHLALEKYQHDLVRKSASARQDTALDRALRESKLDAGYPAWSDSYARDVVAREAYAAGDRTASTLVDAMPAALVSDPIFDFGVKESGIDLLDVMSKQPAGKRAELDSLLAELLGHFGAHTRNAVRGILKAGEKP